MATLVVLGGPPTCQSLQTLQVRGGVNTNPVVQSSQLVNSFNTVAKWSIALLNTKDKLGISHLFDYGADVVINYVVTHINAETTINSQLLEWPSGPLPGPFVQQEGDGLVISMHCFMCVYWPMIMIMITWACSHMLQRGFRVGLAASGKDH